MSNNKILDVMIGHAIGDALGVPVEFRDRDFLKDHPVTDMIGFGTHKVPAGTWSDDTSMSLCALASLDKGKVDYDDIMKNFGKWYYHGDFTVDGNVFDIGNTCATAIDNYHYYDCTTENCGLNSEYSCGNGSLMRIHPFILYAKYNKMPENEFIEMIYKASALTHSNDCVIDGCMIYAYVLVALLQNQSKDSIYEGLTYAKNDLKLCTHYYDRLFKNIQSLKMSDIKSSGYVVDTLEAAIWCLLTTDNYKDCVLKAVNLGDDTDTVAAVAGGLAGALYGIEDIPDKWLEKLGARDYIEKMCDNAYYAWRENN